MRDNLLSESEMAFARIVWQNEPIRSGELVKLCSEKLGWKKPTTYTVLRNLCKAGIFKNEDAVVSALMTQDEYLAQESSKIVNDRFDGSIARFVTAFADKSKLYMGTVYGSVFDHPVLIIAAPIVQAAAPDRDVSAVGAGGISHPASCSDHRDLSSASGSGGTHYFQECAKSLSGTDPGQAGSRG